MPLGRLDPSKLLPWLDPTELINDVMDGRDPAMTHASRLRVTVCPHMRHASRYGAHYGQRRVLPRLTAVALGAIIGAALSSPALGLAASPSPTGAPAHESTFSLETVLDLALTHNPTVASAEGTIEQNRGQQVAANTYLNPSISANSGRGNMRDLGTFDPGARESSPSST